MIAHKISRFVFSSTAALFGTPERTPIEETDKLQPTNTYGASKLLVEEMLAWFHLIHGLCYASLRYFNAAGAAGKQGEDHHPESHLIPLTLQVALGQRESISIFGTDYPTPDGTCVRDYIHVSDLASAHLLVLDELKRKDKLIYNLGNGRGFSVREVIDTVRRVTGQPIPVKEAARRPGDPAILVASSEKIRKELNWTPRYSDLEAIVRSAWDWRRAHPHGYGEKSVSGHYPPDRWKRNPLSIVIPFFLRPASTAGEWQILCPPLLSCRSGSKPRPGCSALRDSPLAAAQPFPGAESLLRTVAG